MATYNTIKEASEAYFAAKEKGDAAGMKAANDAANAIRASNGEAAQYATQDINNVAKQSAASSGSGVSSASASSPASAPSSTPAQGSAAGNVSVTLPNGQKSSSAYVNGKVTGNLPVGSIVHTAGGDYQITGGTAGNYTSQKYTAPAAPSSGNAVDYSDLINNAINSGASWQEVQDLLDKRNAKIGADPSLGKYLYDENYQRAQSYIFTKQQNEAQLAANLAKLQSAFDQSMAGYNAAKEQIAPQYQQARNQTAASSDVNWKQFSDVAAANGLNTGAMGQAALSRGVALQNDLNELNRSEAEEISAIDLEIAKLQAEYQSAIAQAKASGDAELAAALYDQFNSYIAQKRQAQANQLAMQQAAAEAEQARQEDAYNLVVDLITSGLMPTDTQLAAAGMTKADAQYLYNQIIAQKLNGKKGSTGGRGGSKSSSSSSGGGSGSAGSVSTTTTYKPATDLNTGLNNITSANAGGDTGNYAAVSRELLNMRRSGSSDKTMADYLEKQIDNGVVTENQAYQLVNTYGINLNAQSGTKTETSKITIDLSAFPQPIYRQKK